jgi:hypothetical protein
VRTKISLVGLFILIFVSAFAVTAAAAPKHSRVVLKTKKIAGDKVEFDFKVETIGAIVINTDGPWQLQVKQHEGVAFASTELKVKDFDVKIPGFRMTSTAKPQKTAGKLSYKMIVFICTKNKEQCYREVHEQSSDWKML